MHFVRDYIVAATLIHRARGGFVCLLGCRVVWRIGFTSHDLVDSELLLPRSRTSPSLRSSTILVFTADCDMPRFSEILRLVDGPSLRSSAR